MIVFRKVRNFPYRVLSIWNEIKFVIAGFIHSMREAITIRKYITKSKARNREFHKVAVINAARSWAISDIEIFMAHILSIRGLTTYVLFDDGILEHWDGAQVHNFKYYSPYRARWCIKARHIIRKRLVWLAYRNSNMRLINYSQIVRQVPLKKNENGQKGNKAYALSSSKRFFETGAIDIESQHRNYYLKSLKNCYISATVGRYVVEKLKPDLYITSHGIYSVWGPAYQKVKSAGIPIVVWQVPGTTNGFIRLIDRQDQVLASTEDWKMFDAGTPNSEDIISWGKMLLNKRIKHQSQDTREYFHGRLSKQALDNVTISNNKQGITFGMFPNVAWDGDTNERNLLFDNVIDWCEFTIKAIQETNHHLYIRFHPSEMTRLKGSVKLQNILRERIVGLDRFHNITLIESDQHVDTYAFAKKFIDIGLIYDGTLCLELTHMGIPVIASTNGNFTVDAVVYKPESKKQYKHWLDRPEELIEIFTRERLNRETTASKYAYWLFEHSLLEFKPLRAPYPAKIDYTCWKDGEPMSKDAELIYARLIKAMSSVGTR